MMSVIKPLRKVARKSGLTKPPVQRTRAQERILDAEAWRSDRPSVLFFTTHKCASTLISKVLHTIETSSDLRHFDYATAVYKLGDEVETGTIEHTDIEQVIDRNKARLFHSTGEIYGPLRRPIDVPGREEMTQLFFLRDPRDVIVSAYYSFGFSHGLPPNAQMQSLFLAERERIRGEGIDRYALRAARDWIGPTLRRYADYRRTGSDTHYLTYDSYTEDPAGFLDRVFDLVGARVDPAEIERMATAARPIQTAAAADVPAADLTHQRSGRSGQFRTELSEETLGALDDMLADVLEFWGFAGASAGG